MRAAPNPDTYKQKPRRIGQGFLRSQAARSRRRYSLPLPSPPAEQTTARKDQTGQASANDGAGDGRQCTFQKIGSYGRETAVKEKLTKDRPTSIADQSCRLDAKRKSRINIWPDFVVERELADIA